MQTTHSKPTPATPRPFGHRANAHLLTRPVNIVEKLERRVPWLAGRKRQNPEQVKTVLDRLNVSPFCYFDDFYQRFRGPFESAFTGYVLQDLFEGESSVEKLTEQARTHWGLHESFLILSTPMAGRVLVNGSGTFYVYEVDLDSDLDRLYDEELEPTWKTFEEFLTDHFGLNPGKAERKATNRAGWPENIFEQIDAKYRAYENIPFESHLQPNPAGVLAAFRQLEVDPPKLFTDFCLRYEGPHYSFECEYELQDALDGVSAILPATEACRKDFQLPKHLLSISSFYCGGILVYDCLQDKIYEFIIKWDSWSNYHDLIAGNLTPEWNSFAEFLAEFFDLDSTPPAWEIRTKRLQWLYRDQRGNRLRPKVLKHLQALGIPQRCTQFLRREKSDRIRLRADEKFPATDRKGIHQVRWRAPGAQEQFAARLLPDESGEVFLIRPDADILGVLRWSASVFNAHWRQYLAEFPDGFILVDTRFKSKLAVQIIADESSDTAFGDLGSQQLEIATWDETWAASVNAWAASATG